MAHWLPVWVPYNATDSIMMVHLERDPPDNADLLVIGDSTAFQIGTALAEQYPSKVTNYGLNAAVELTGDYLILKRYFARNAKPLAVVLIEYLPLDKNLKIFTTETYVQRIFLHWSEIAELTRLRGITFGSTILLHKFLPSYRFRFSLQKVLSCGIVARPMLVQNQDFAPPTAIYSKRTDIPISNRYFVRIAEWLTEQGIPLYIVPPPISTFSATETSPHYRDIQKSYAASKELADRYPLVHFVGPPPMLPDTLFKNDHVHFSPQEGVQRAVEYVRPLVESLLPPTM